MPSIEQYRALGQKVEGMEEYQRPHRVMSEGGKLVTGTSVDVVRLVQWIVPTETFKSTNRSTIDDFRAALEQAYGKTIADQVYNTFLHGQYTGGHNLSARRITASLDLAEKLRGQNFSGNIRAMRDEWQKMLGDFALQAGKPLKDLVSPQEMRQMEQQYLKVFNHDPRMLSESLDSEAGRAYLRAGMEGVVEEFLEHRHSSLAQQFGNIMSALELSSGDVPSKDRIREAIRDLALEKENLSLTEMQSFDVAKDILVRAYDTLGRSQDLLDGCPLEQGEIEDHHERIEAQVTRLNAHRARLEKLVNSEDERISTLAKAMIDDIDSHLENLNAKKEYLHYFDGYHPLSQENVNHAKDLMCKGAVRLIEKYKAELPNLSPQELKEFEGAIAYLKNMSRLMKEPPRDGEEGRVVENPKEEMSGHHKFLLEYIRDVLGERAPGMKDLEKAFKAQHVEAMNRDQSWEPVEGEVQFNQGGRLHRHTSKVTPAGNLSSLEESYGEVRGVCSEDKSQSEHCVNLAITTLHNERGEEIFSGTRHGIHSATGLKEGSQERLEANIKRAKESVVGALESNKEVMAKALENARLGKDEPVTLDISSLSLVTPAPDWAKGEKTRWEDQERAWKHINENPEMTIKVRDPESGEMRDVKIRVNVIAFNFGVNPGAMGVAKLGPIPVPRAGWSDEVMETNRKGLEQMIGSFGQRDEIGGLAGKYLARDDISAKDRRVVQELIHQIREIWNNGSFKCPEGDVYKMVSRIAMLAYKIGASPMWNCMSGKDRTGHLDAELKYLAAMIDTTGHVPPYGKLDKEGESIFREFALHGGNHEIQRYNTGFSGYKTFNVSSNEERVGEDEIARKLYRGAGKFVKT